MNVGIVSFFLELFILSIAALLFADRSAKLIFDVCAPALTLALTQW